MLNRRQWLVAGGLTLGSPFGAHAALGHPDALYTGPFGTEPALQPLRGWVDAQDRLAEGLRVEGRLPAALRGTLYRNGPGLLERAGQRYAHWFDGDGLVQAWHFEGAAVRHTARFVRTRKFELEHEAGAFLLPAFGTAIPARRPLRSSDDVNTANTGVILQGGRLYALWEGGSAHELDPETLHTRGRKVWAPELTGMPFSAHPKREPDGTLWNFGAFMGKLALYQIGPHGALVRSRVLDLPVAAMVHDFVLTERFLVFVLPPLELDPQGLREGRSLVGAMRWRAEQPNRIVVIDKSDLSVRTVLEAPPELLFHFGNAWDDGDALIRLDYVSTDHQRFLSGGFNSMLHGHRSEPFSPSNPRLVQIDLRKRRVTLASRLEQVEFPQVDPRVVGRAYRYVFYPEARGRRWGEGAAVLRVDLQRDRTERFDFGPGVIVEEQLLVPKPGRSREGQGWLVGTGFDSRRQRSFCTVFDAEAVSAGPVATVWLPYWAPLGFHGHFQFAA
ncbi:carotenoid oxygenase family protein [Inhella gelatinilytica]|uniref:Carotenoid oxygenase family protein n=1 Tax=Inhella gelatinilytica TaxID=2795030 RepID=A0A931IXK3_9BURK|nr:carotenoid oxygenase family protein [Inhella gelatinilytica]MBH9553752.1 carotenoid oxygenase family protein [Inhella gelatinilytica]